MEANRREPGVLCQPSLGAARARSANPSGTHVPREVRRALSWRGAPPHRGIRKPHNEIALCRTKYRSKRIPLGTKSLRHSPGCVLGGEEPLAPLQRRSRSAPTAGFGSNAERGEDCFALTRGLVSTRRAAFAGRVGAAGSARTGARRRWPPLTERQRSLASAISLEAAARLAVLDPGPLVSIARRVPGCTPSSASREARAAGPGAGGARPVRSGRSSIQTCQDAPRLAKCPAMSAWRCAPVSKDTTRVGELALAGQAAWSQVRAGGET